MNRFAVMGYPVSHSLSPRIHCAFGDLVGRPVSYERREVRPLGLATAFAAFVRDGGRGANVTVPLKGEAFSLAQRVTDRARRAQAVNTLYYEGDTLAGDNTDGVGLIRDLTVNQGLVLAGARVLLLGAGGAAWGIAGPLLDEGLAVLAVVNRTPARAKRLVAVLDDERVYLGAEGAAAGPYDLVINATAAGLAGDLPALPAEAFAGAVVYDLVYGPAAQAFLAHARAQGARQTVDGLGMLVEQAAESFFIWQGVRPPTAPVLAQLRSTA